MRDKISTNITGRFCGNMMRLRDSDAGLTLKPSAEEEIIIWIKEARRPPKRLMARQRLKARRMSTTILSISVPSLWLLNTADTGCAVFAAEGEYLNAKLNSRGKIQMNSQVTKAVAILHSINR